MATAKTKKIGKYEILDVLGKGGMGIVYKAIDPGIERLVAIKMITGNYADDAGFLKRFYREAQSTGKLQHPNIVIVHDLGDHEGTPFLVMELLEGETVDVIIKEKRSLPILEKLNVMIQVCNGLHYAHERNVIHRDIKPGNLMLLKGSGTVKIVDFGIAHIEDDANVTMPSQLIGTIQYMSPEQINGIAVDCRSDVFSTAVVLYQLLAYALPFAGKDTGSTLLKIINDPPPSLSNYLPIYPPELDEVIKRGLAKSREDRYQTAEEFAFDLMQVQEQLRKIAVSDYLRVADDLLAREELSKAKEQCLQILRVDRYNGRAKELLQEVQQRFQRQQRVEQARQLWAHAQEAFTLQEFERALSYLNQAVELDSNNHELQAFRESVAQDKTRADQRREALKRAQSAQYADDLTDALRSVEEALALDAADNEARALHAEIVLELEQRKLQREVQKLVGQAQQQISQRQFTTALEWLQKAQILDPSSPAIRELMALTASGREQERRRKELERLIANIEDALNHDDFALACRRAEESLKQFPEERALLKLQSMAAWQRQAAEKRQYVEEQIASARKLLDDKQTEPALRSLQVACEHYPNEPALLSLLSIVQQTLEQERAEARKNTCIQQAKEALRSKRVEQAIQILEAGFAELRAPELENLLQFAQEEKAAQDHQERIEAAAQEAHRLMSLEQHERAVSFLRATLNEVSDEELQILLADAERHVDEINRRAGEVVDTAERMLQADRVAEAVRFLDAQPESFARSSRFREIVGRAHEGQERLRHISAAVEQAQAALRSRNWEAAEQTIEQCRRAYGDHPELARTAAQVEAGRREAATTAVNKAVNDCRMLLMGRSYQSALELLESVAAALEFIPEELRLRHLALHLEAERGLASNQEQPPKVTRSALPAGNDAKERTAWTAPGTTTPPSHPDLARARDLEELGKRTQELEVTVAVDELHVISARARRLAQRHGADGQVQTSAAETENLVISAAPQVEEVQLPPSAIQETSSILQEPPRREAPSSTVALPAPAPAFQTQPPTLDLAPSRVSMASKRLAVVCGVFAIALAAVLMWMLRPSKPVSETSRSVQPEAVATASTSMLGINTTPVGATVAVQNQTCVTPNCRIKLTPGDYELRTSMLGYAPDSRLIHLGGDKPAAPLEIALKPLPGTAQIHANFNGGQVWLDGKSLGKLRGGDFKLDDLPTGQHTLKISGKDKGAEVIFSDGPARAPEIRSPISAKGLSAVVIADFPGVARVACNCEDGTSVSLDGQQVARIQSGQVDLGATASGSHQLQLGEGAGVTDHIFNISGRPALDIILNERRNSQAMSTVNLKANSAGLGIKSDQRDQKEKRGAIADVPTGADKKGAKLRCEALTARVQLGEMLNEEERTYLKETCH